jgi:hypothetical protein
VQAPAAALEAVVVVVGVVAEVAAAEAAEDAADEIERNECRVSSERSNSFPSVAPVPRLSVSAFLDGGRHENSTEKIHSKLIYAKQ